MPKKIALGMRLLQGVSDVFMMTVAMLWVLGIATHVIIWIASYPVKGFAYYYLFYIPSHVFTGGFVFLYMILFVVRLVSYISTNQPRKFIAARGALNTMVLALACITFVVHVLVFLALLLLFRLDVFGWGPTWADPTRNPEETLFIVFEGVQIAITFAVALLTIPSAFDVLVFT